MFYRYIYRVSFNFATAFFLIFNAVCIENNLDVEYSLHFFNVLDT